MRLAVLYSGGKDSNFALFLSKIYGHEIKCLILIKSKNKESYMFQTPGNDFIKFLSKNLDIPLIEIESKGKKEEELKDLEKGIIEAKNKYNIDGVVSGAIESIYQASRIQKICYNNKLYSINPLWKINEENYLEYLIKFNFKIEIIGIFSYPFTKNLIGKKIDKELISYLKESNKKYKTSLIGEGGEFETFVVDSPLYKKELILEYKKIDCDGENSCVGIIKDIKPKEKIVKNKQIENNQILVSSNSKSIFLNYSNIDKNSKKNILIVSSIFEMNSIYDLEYLRPLVQIIDKLNLNYEIVHFSEIPKKTDNFFSKFEKIIISGTCLLDFDYFENLNSFDKIFKLNKDIFGICAGAQIIAKKFEVELKKNQKIGIEKIKLNLDKNKDKNSKNKEEKIIETYELRNYGIFNSENIEILGTNIRNEIEYFKIRNKKFYGTLFHPEVRGNEILEEFLKK